MSAISSLSHRKRSSSPRLFIFVQAAIDRFSSSDSNSFLFLLGTRAGGVGINLTAADTVILYDPDWNPQNDIQAQARCHRIGQTRTVRIYRLITRGTYEESMAKRANQKLGLEQAIIGSHDYGAGKTVGAEDPDNTTLKLSKAKEIEELLKHGAQNLFAEKHNDQIEAFSSESIEQILERCATTRIEVGSKAATDEAGQSKSSFAKASFVSNEGSSLDINDPDFWSHVLGEPAPEEEEVIDYDNFGPRSRPRRSVGEPQRLAPSWETATSAFPEPLAMDIAAGSTEPAPAVAAMKAVASKPKRVAWTRAQLNGLFSGLFAFGSGRAKAVQMHSAALGSRSLTEISYAIDYTIQLALRESAIADTISKEGKGNADEGKERDESHGCVPLNAAEEERVLHLWHFLLCGRQLAQGGSPHAPPGWVEKSLLPRSEPHPAPTVPGTAP